MRSASHKIKKHPMSVADAGWLGGKARAENMTAEERSESSRKAAKVRWDRYREAKLENEEKPRGTILGEG